MMRESCLGVVLGTVFLAGLVSGCSESSPVSGTSVPSPEIVETGSWYVRYEWPHDGHPYESEHLTVYSDTSSLEMRAAVAELGEQLLADIISDMDIAYPVELFHFPPEQDKIEIYAFKDRPSQKWGGRAYYGGLLIHAMDHEGFGASGLTEPENYAATLKHELVHVVESLLKGRGPTEAPWVDVWFSEGLAETISGGAASSGINGLDHLDSLTNEYGSLNPVSFRSDGQVCTTFDAACFDAYGEYHYPMWYLAVEYLLDDSGMGRSAADAAAVFVDMGLGVDFPTAFESHMGIAVEEYREQFFARMDTYLPARSTSPVFSTFGLISISVLAVGLALAYSVVAFRQSSIPGASDNGSGVASVGRPSRIAFATWVVAIAVFSVVLFLRGVFTISGSWEFDDGEKASALGISVGFLAVATMVLSSAVIRRRHQSRVAWAMTIVATCAAVLTMVALQSLV